VMSTKPRALSGNLSWNAAGATIAAVRSAPVIVFWLVARLGIGSAGREYQQ
jgi:hypothetical protein